MEKAIKFSLALIATLVLCKIVSLVVDSLIILLCIIVISMLVRELLKGKDEGLQNTEASPSFQQNLSSSQNAQTTTSNN